MIRNMPHANACSIKLTQTRQLTHQVLTICPVSKLSVIEVALSDLLFLALLYKLLVSVSDCAMFQIQEFWRVQQVILGDQVL